MPGKRDASAAQVAPKHSEMALLDSEGRFRLLLESIALGIIGVDEEGLCTFCNPAAIQLLGYKSADQLIGKNLHSFFRHTLPDGTPFPDNGANPGQTLRFQDAVLWKADGTSFHAACWWNHQGNGNQVLGAVLAFVEITDRHREQLALQKSEEKFTKAFREAPMALTVTSAVDHRYIDVNHTFELITGWSREEIIGRTPFDLGIWVDPQQRYEVVRRTLAEEGIRDFEVSFRAKDGSKRLGLASVQPIVIEAEQMILSVIRDITDEKRAFQELTDSELKFRTVFNDAPSGMVMGSIDGRFLAANRAYCKFVGYTEAELRGKDFRLVTHPDDIATSVRFLEGLVSGRTPNIRFEQRYLHKSGQILWGEVSSSVIRDASGNPSYIISQTVDVSERKRALEELQQSEERLRTIFQDARQAMTLADTQGHYVAVNRSFCDFLGYTEEELLAKDLVSVSHPEGRAEALEMLRTLNDGLGQFRIEKRYLHKNGKVRWGDLSRSIIRNRDGKPLYVLSQIVDITERKRVETALHETERLLRSSLKATQEQLQFQTLLAEISSKFVSLPCDEIDAEIGKSLKIICKALDIDHSSIFQVTHDPGALVITHVIRDPGLESPPEYFEAGEYFPWCLERLLKGEVICLPSTRNAPAEAATDKASWERYGIKSTFAIPMLAGGRKLVGIWGVDSAVEERTWPELLQTKLKLIAEVLANAIERKELDQQLRSRERELSEAQRVARVGSWTSSLNDELTWSDELYRIHRRDPSLGAPTWEELELSLTPESRQRLKAMRQEGWRSGSIPSEDLEIIFPDGSCGWVATRGEVERDSSDRIVRFRGTVQDITERKLVETRLREYEQAIENSKEMIAIVDRDYHYVVANQAYLNYRQLTREQVVGHSVQEVIADDLVFEESVRPFLEQCFAGITTRYETRFKYPELGERYLEMSYVPIEVGSGIDRILLAIEDVTDRRKAEEALKEGEERFRRVVEHIGDALLVDDVEGHVVFANDQFLTLFGFKREQLKNIRVEDYIAPEYVAELRERHQRRVRGETVPTRFEVVGCRPDGERIWLEADVVPIKGTDGSIAGTQSLIRDITSRRQLETELRQRESDLREAQRIAVVGSWTWNPRTDAVTVSDEFLTIIGCNPKEPIPPFKELERFFESGTWHALNAALQSCLNTCLSFEVDTEVIPPDGEKRWFTHRGEAVLDKFGAVDYLRGTVQDVTHRKLADRALRESEVRYRSLVESSKDWIWEVDADGKFTHAGPQCRQILGYEVEEVLGRNPFHFMPSAEAARVAGKIAAIAKQKKPYRGLENINLHKDGHEIVFETNGVPMFDEGGNLVGYRGTAQDITRRKRAEEALRQSEQKFSTLFRTAPVAIGLHQLDGRFVDVNDAFEALTGYTREEVLGRNTQNLGLWGDPLGTEPVRAELLRDGKIHDLELEFRTKNGEIRLGVLSAELIDIQGETYILGVFKDLTEQKRAEQVLREFSSRLIRAQEDERKRIARDLHDDINQRLAMVAVHLQQLQTEAEKDGHYGKELEQLFKETTSVASDIQTLSHQLHSSNLDYLGLVPAIRGFVADLARKHQAQIEFKHTGVPKSISAEVDLALFRITQEALHNAVKYSGVKDFEVSLSATSENVELIVRDSGVGFGPEAVKGRGLGLISMQERVVPLKGKVAIESRPNQGTEITVRVPRPKAKVSKMKT